MEKLFKNLQSHVDGEIHSDAIHRKVYSVDASIYEVEPLGIVIPRSKEALVTAMTIASEQGIPIIPRGAATGITGGCLGRGLIIDTSKYLNRILEINWEQEYVVCEPGVVQDRLNEALAARGYRLGPDTSTGNRATIGGMLANNAAGARSLIYGIMADHTLEVELILASGEKEFFQEISAVEWEQRSNTDKIYNALWNIKNTYSKDIAEHFQKIPRRVSGYNLEALLNKTVNPCRMIAGSEGTLGIASEIKLKIVKKSAVTGVCLLFLSDLSTGLRAVEEMLTHHPIAIEMIDHKIIEMGRQSPSMRGKLNWLQGYPEAVFIVEFDGDNEQELHMKMERFARKMKAQKVIYDQKEISHVWELRKSGLGLLLSKRSYSRAIAFLEDVSVAPKQLAHFMEKFCAYMKSKGESAGIYGHVGSGCMHIRPYIDLRQQEQIQLMEQMMHDVSDLLLEHGGALSGEHGDGLVRSWLNKKMFGERVYEAFLELKRAFDPNNVMNPGKIVNGPPLLQDLRLNPATPIVEVPTFLDFKKEGGFELAADLCNGNGLCRKSEKLMCPSFQATQDEFHSTRARAQALRSIIHKRLPLDALSSDGLHDVLDLCLECKGCKTECPSEVDMAKMKAEVLYHYHKKHGMSLRNHFFSYIGQISQIASFFPSLFHKLSSFNIPFLKITTQRSLPKIAPRRFSRGINQSHHEKQVVLFLDTFTEFYCPEIGHAAIKAINALGYFVIIPSWHCCGRPALSKGKLPFAKNQAQKVIDVLLPYAMRGLKIIGLEPSCLLTIKDDYEGLLGHQKQEVQQVIAACTTFDEWIASHMNANAFQTIPSDLLLHGHCHQKALVGMKPTLAVLNALSENHASEIPSGCCGMAGSFGYEEEHYDISMKVGELSLFPTIRKSSGHIVANGFSCRSQIAHGTGHRAYHLAELLVPRE